MNRFALTICFVLLAWVAGYPFDHIYAAEKESPILNLTLAKQRPDSCILQSRGRALAFLIGINQYNNNKVSNLIYPKSEADSLATLLRSQGYDTIVLGDSLATRKNVLYVFQKWILTRKPVDRVLFYFSGHGMKFSELSAKMDDRNFKKHYQTDNAILNMLRVQENNLRKLVTEQTGDLQNSLNSAKTSMQMNSGDNTDYLMLILHQEDADTFKDVIGAHEIISVLSLSRAHQKIVIIDACFSGNIKDFSLFSSLYSSRIITDGFFAITGAKQKSKDGKHSPYLFAGLAGAADTTWAGNKDHYVSIYELAVFLDGNLRFLYKNETGAIYKTRFVFAGSGEVMLTKY